MLNPTSFRTLGLLMVAAVLLTVPGCRSAAARAARAGKVEITGAGAAGTPLGIHVENALGETVIEVDRRFRAPSVLAYPMDSAGGRVRGASTAWVAAEQIESEGRSTLRVLALEQEGANRRPIYIRVRVPEGRGVSVRNAGGPVRLVGVSGPLEVQADAAEGAGRKRGASISVVMSAPADSPISLLSGEGAVRLEMPASSEGRLEVRAPRRILEFEARGARVTAAKTSGDTYTATLNGGTNPVVLSSRGGEVEVRLR